MLSSKGKPSKKTTTKASNLIEGDVVDVDYGRLQTLSKFVHLKDVELARLSFESQLAPAHLLNEQEGQSEFSLNVSEARWFRSDELFEVALCYDLLASFSRGKKAKERTSLFFIKAYWVASYSLPTTFERPQNHEEAAADFVMANGQVNIFPFLRQLVVDMTAKAGWAPLWLPVFRVPKSRPRSLVKNLPVWDFGHDET